MTFLILLFCMTVIIAWLEWISWKKTNNLFSLLTTIIIYIWSIAGAWFIVFDLLNDNSLSKIGVHYYDYFNKLFSIELNQDYFNSIIYLSLFVIGYQLSVIFFSKKKSPQNIYDRKITLRHETLIFISLISLALSFFFIRQQMQEALIHHESFYIFISHNNSKYYSLYQLFKSCSLIAAYSGLVIYLNRENSAYFMSNKFRLSIPGYSLLMLIVIFYSLMLGSRHDLIFSALFGLLLYLIDSKKIKYQHLLILFSSMIIPVFMIELTRGIPLLDYLGINPGSASINEPAVHLSGSQTFLSLIFSNEFFVGHMSMYGVVHNNMTFTNGSSFLSLLSSFIPRFLVSERPPDIYQYYITIAKDPGLQGFTINHATGWYLNFGITGIIIGGVLLGVCFSFCRNLLYSSRKHVNTFYQCFSILALAGFVAFLPMLIRTGPEGYKGLLFEGILIPVLIIWISQFSIFQFFSFWLQKKKLKSQLTKIKFCYKKLNMVQENLATSLLSEILIIQLIK